MPLYLYSCSQDGLFEIRRPLAEAASPLVCPWCGQPAQRVFTPPNVPRTPKWIAEGLAREERSRHEPRVVTREEIGLPSPDPEPKPRWHRAHGRPWMIGH